MTALAELILDGLDAVLRPLAHGFGLDDIGELDDDVQLSRVCLLVSQIQHGELAAQSLEGRVRLVHHLIERILNDGDGALRQDHPLLGRASLVVDLNLDLLGEPLCDSPDSQLLDVEAVVGPRVQVRFDRNDCDDTLVEQRQHGILDEGSAALVDVGLQHQAVVQG